MPRLPTYSAKLDGGVVSGGRRATAEDAGAVDLTGAVRDIQKTGLMLAAQERQQQKEQSAEAERLRKQQEAQAARDAAIRGATVVAKGRNDFLDYLNNLGQKSTTEVPDVTAAFVKGFDDFKDKALEQEEHPEGKLKLAIDLDNMRAGLLDNAFRMQAQRAGQAASAAVKDVFSQNAVAVQKSPNQLEALMAQEERLIQNLNFPGLTDAQRQRLKEERRHVLPGAAIGARIAAAGNSRDARAIKTELETNKRWEQLLSGQQFAHAMNAVTTDIRQYERAERAEYRAAVLERVAERAAGVQNGLSAREAGGDPKLAAAIVNAEATGRARTDIKSVPFNDMVTMVRDAQTKLMAPGGFKGDVDYLQAVQAAAEERMRAIKLDPAGYVVQNSNAVKKAYDAMADSQFSPESVRRYAAVSAEAQREMGGPAHSVKLLPKQLVDNVVAEVASLPPEQAANKMEGLQRQFGPLWTEVLGEMRGKVPVGITTLGRLTDPQDAHVRVDLASALKAGPDLRKNIPDVEAKDTDRRVEEALLPYSRIVSQAGAGAQVMLREELAAAKALAYQAVARGESPDGAAKKAVNALIFNRYDTGDTFLAPKGMLSLAQREAARVMRETPASVFTEAAGGDPALSSKYRREANKAEASKGFWANVTDLSSGKLGIEWRNSDSTPVRLEGGDRVRLFFDDLKALPPAPRQGALPRDFSQTPGGAVTR